LNIIIISINVGGGLDEVGGGGGGWRWWWLLIITYSTNAICWTPVAVASVRALAIVVAVLTCWPFRVYAYRSVPVRMVYTWWRYNGCKCRPNTYSKRLVSWTSYILHFFGVFLPNGYAYTYLSVCVFYPARWGNIFTKYIFLVYCVLQIYLYIHIWIYASVSRVTKQKKKYETTRRVEKWLK